MRPSARASNLDLWVFLGITFGLTWAADLALWLAGPPFGTRTWVAVVAATMFSPALAAWITERFVTRRPDLAARTGLRIRVGEVRWKRYWLLAWFGTPVVVFGSVALAAALGFFQLDLAGLSTLRATVEATPEGAKILETVSLHKMLIANVISGILLAPLVNGLPVFGEEWGWRGWLLPRLWSLGPWRALLLHGVIWGLWHAPIILMGHNYPAHPYLGILMMVVMCVLLGILMGWLRLATGSIWPAVIAHASINGLVAIVSVIGMQGVSYDNALVGVTGVTGWVVMLVAIAILLALKQLPTPPPPAPDIAEGWAAPADGSPAPPG